MADYIVDVVDVTTVVSTVDVVDVEAEVTVVDLTASGVGGAGSVAKLTDLLDVNSSNLNSGTNKYVLTYDVNTQKFVFSNPDDVIDASVGIRTDDPSPVGFSSGTIDYLDRALDNKIDLDAGEW